MQPLCEPYNGNLHDVHLATCTRRPRSVEGPILSFFSSARNVGGDTGFFSTIPAWKCWWKCPSPFTFFLTKKTRVKVENKNRDVCM